MGGLLRDIKNKKELRQVSDTFVRAELSLYLQQHPQQATQLAAHFHPRSAPYRQVLKGVRTRLRRVYGVFHTTKESRLRRELFIQWKEKPAVSLLEKILKTHTSPRERMPFARQFYQKLFFLVGKPTSILDLGCGIHPLALPGMGLSSVRYFAYDLGEEEVGLLQEFFAVLQAQNPRILGKAEIQDVLRGVRNLPEADLCFLLKMTDVLDRGKGHKATERVVQEVRAKAVVISFPTLTLSGQPMRFPRRRWIELMCQRLGYAYEILHYPAEIFYVVRKAGERSL